MTSLGRQSLAGWRPQLRWKADVRLTFDHFTIELA